jgi:hypothetical protein
MEQWQRAGKRRDVPPDLHFFTAKFPPHYVQCRTAFLIIHPAQFIRQLVVEDFVHPSDKFGAGNVQAGLLPKKKTNCKRLKIAGRKRWRK